MQLILLYNPTMRVILHIDGGARGNPGPAGAGVVIQCADSGKYVHEHGYFLGHATNNFAEYTGLIKGLEAALQLGAQHVAVHSDSQLMVRQLLGQYRVKSESLRPLYEQARTLLRCFPSANLTHVPRERNELADRLANEAMDAKADVDYTQRD